MEKGQLVNRSKIEAKNNNELIFNNRRSLSTSIHSINEVIQKYGENYYEYTVQGVQTIGYIDHGNRCKIDFWYVDGKVITIIFPIRMLILTSRLMNACSTYGCDCCIRHYRYSRKVAGLLNKQINGRLQIEPR